MPIKNTFTAPSGTKIEYVRLDRITDFDVKKTFDCGQCFRFEPVENSRHEREYAGVARGKLISIGQDGDTLYIYNTNEHEFEHIWRRYLALDTDYGEIADNILSLSDNPALKKAMSVGRGIRILAQEPWETICSFIISQNNNIPRIKKIINSLSSRFGEPVDAAGMEEHGANDYARLHSFPSAKAIVTAGVDLLYELKTGFRAKYIIDAAQRSADGRLDYEFLASNPDTDACAEHLKTVKGIGDKVAACALLFGFGKLDAFPVDVWIKRVLAKYFPPSFDKNSLGPYAGIAQQYLFYYERWLGGGIV